jgi:hypothetical protein
MGRKAKRVAAEVARTPTGAGQSEAANENPDVVSESEAVEVGAAFDFGAQEGATIVAIDELEVLDLEAIETTLTDAEEAALEAGIASVFDTILAEGFAAPVAGNDDHLLADDDAGEPADGEGDADPTIALLAELNRIWAQPLAA